MEDLSVDTSGYGRPELLAKLNHHPTTSKGLDKLKLEFKNLLKKNHPIHSYLNNLTQENSKRLHSIFFPDSRYQSDRIKRSIANEMFRYFPKAPLNTLAWILRKDYVPSKTEFEMILQSLKKSRAFDLSQETPDLNDSRNEKDTSKIIPDIEMRSESKRFKDFLVIGKMF